MAENCYCTQNDCYKEGKKLDSVSYLIVHTPAVYPTIIRALSGSGGGWKKRWDKPDVEKLVHGFIDDTGVYEFAPPDMACWHIGDSWGNKNCIGYELCELETAEEFKKVWENAASHYAALCGKYDLPPERVIGHFEAHEKGFASNHSDPEPYFARFGKTMKDFRAEVSARLSAGSGASSGAEEGDGSPGAAKAYDPWAYARVTNLTADDPLLNVRTGPGTKYGVIRQLAQGNEVDVIEEYENGWAKINIVGQQGYVNAHYLDITDRGSSVQTATVVNCTALNVRKTPNGAVSATIHKGDVVQITGSGKDSDGDTWTKIQCGNVSGYVWPKYID